MAERQIPMKRWLGDPLVQYRFGLVVLVTTSPLFAVLIRRPLVKLAGNGWLAMREHIWLPEHGKHYVFRGMKIRVQEGEDLRRWVSLEDVRKLVEIRSSDQTLAATYPGQWRQDEETGQAELLAEALVSLLDRRMDGDALRLRTWLQRNVVLPSQRLRGLGPS
jgi:hypothetical protein